MSRRKGAPTQTRKGQHNGLYIHSSPPRVVNVTSARVKQLVRAGDLDKLEAFVIQGQGAKLLGEFSSDFKIRKFIRNQVPAIMSKITQLHDAVASGSLEDLKAILQDDCGRRKKLVLCKDQAGVGLLHKAVYYDLPDIYKFLIETYPQTATVRDAEGRTAAHYVAMCRDSVGVQRLLAATGADLHATDKHGHTYKYYMDNPAELELPTANKPSISNGSDKSTSASSRASKDNLVIKPSNIRIWIHQRDLGKLQRVLWEGQGMKLKTEHCNNPKIKKFLEAVPHLMGVIKDIHSAAINGDLDMIRQRTEPPVLPIILSSKDQNSLTTLHKAAGLGHIEVARFIAYKYPTVVNTGDAEGRTPLHYAALLKDGDDMYNMILDAGAEESALDNKQKAAGYYRTRPNEIDTKLLSVIPEAPRTSSANFPPNWDWNLLIPTETNSADEPKKIKKKSDSVFGITPNEESKPLEKLVDEISPKNTAAKGSPKTPPAEELSKSNQVEEQEPNTDEKEDGEQDDDVISPEDDDVITEIPTEKTNGHSTAEVLEIESEEEADPQVEDPPAEEDAVPKLEDPPEDDLGQTTDEVVDSQEVGIIEGVVNGEDEVETLNNDENNSISAENDNEDPVEIDTSAENIAEMVEGGNMEQLAAIVLNGEGDKLVGQTSENQEIQAFLDNVPIYMSKINRIHVAAREGSLRDLQAALDRRKFAIAKDPRVSPNGATPLHVATIFGNTNIVRYLAGRFPETVQQVDNKGRTPLHYAATLADNGHYYNLLIHLGASASTKDKMEKDAEYYLTRPEELNHKMLLQEFGATGTEADDMLTDKENQEAPPTTTTDIPLFRTEEGRYLATSLGDPLIKGLTEVANKRPEDPIAYLATYLYNFANNNNNNNNKRARTQESKQKNDGAAAAEGGTSTKNNNPVDVVAVDPKNDEDSVPPDTAFSAATRDEHGQSMLHFAAARQHGRNALFQLLQETDINLGYRDELYRTARDVSIQAGMTDNTKQIDKYIVFLAANGDTDKLVELLLEGYDHIIDIVDEEDVPILQVVEKQGDTLQDTIAFLHSVLTFEERRERVHHAIRQGSMEQIQEMLADEKDTGSGKLLAIGKNSYGRCTLHIAVLCQQEEIVDYLANTFPDTLQISDNLERTALHYAMGVDKVESISKLLIEAGGKRVMKDLKGRQASYYFMNKADILRLQEEEETF